MNQHFIGLVNHWADENGCGKDSIKEKIEKFNEARNKGSVNTSSNENVISHLTKSGEGVNLKDEIVPKSVGAKWSNYYIKLPSGEKVNLVEGSHITNKEIIAGKGNKKEIRQADGLSERYGGKPENWLKVKGIGEVSYHGEPEKAEIHWYESSEVGRVDFKVKVQEGGEWWLKK